MIISQCIFVVDGDQFGEDEEPGDDFVPLSAIAVAKSAEDCHGSASLYYTSTGSEGLL